MHQQRLSPEQLKTLRTEQPAMTATTSFTGITWLRSAALSDGRVVDVCLDAATGTITEILDARRELPRSDQPVAPPSANSASGPASEGGPGNTITSIDLDGYLLLPAPAEPHAHLDKALTAELIPNPKGDLMGAITAWVENAHEFYTFQDIIDRARKAALEMLHSGATAIRTHVNVQEGIETDAAAALLVVRNELASLMDIQIVALIGGDTTPESLARLKTILDMDPEIVVGGCPHLDVDGARSTETLLNMAAQYGRQIDLHTDETLDASVLDLTHLARLVRETEFAFGATASHCVSLAMQPLDVQKRVAEQVAAAGVHIIALPQTNLFLQGRDHRIGSPRGLTAIGALRAAGVNVAAGADNIRDPFNSMGRSDPMETAALMVMAGHLLPEAAYASVSANARLAMALPEVTISVGSPAELLAIPGASVGDAIARADQQRMVFHRGRLVSSTSVQRTLAHR
jgi:cytosine/creatinine deaminase